jgi:phenylacetate-coenzyme A ligase PaaK-like adenylate-forming protein
MSDQSLTAVERETLERVYADLRRLANHDTPAVRGGVRLALGDVAQVLAALGLRYELYSGELSDPAGDDLRAYWDPATETMPRDRLAALQLHKLKAQLHHAYAHSPFFRALMDEAKLHPDEIHTLEDYFARFPLVERSQLVRAEQAAPPFGRLAAADARHAIARHQTSGSSGQPPFRSFDTARDWAWLTDRFALALYALGVRPGDQVAVAFGYGMFLGFWAAHYGVQRLGAVPISTGTFDSEQRLRLLTEERVQVFLSTPTYALRLAHVAQERGIDLARDTDVRLVVTSGEARRPAARRAIEAAWGAHCGEVAGMTEAGLIMFECGPGSKGMHIVETDFIEEVLDADTREPVGYGEQGVRILTSLGREGVPMLRYWTNDLVVRKPHTGCGCGRTWDFYEGGILGRTDDVCKLRGCLVTPGLIEDVVFSFDEIEEFQARIATVDALDSLVITVEPRSHVPADGRAAVASRIADEVKRSVGVRPTVELADAGALPRFELKSKRMHDAR